MSLSPDSLKFPDTRGTFYKKERKEAIFPDYISLGKTLDVVKGQALSG